MHSEEAGPVITNVGGTNLNTLEPSHVYRFMHACRQTNTMHFAHLQHAVHVARVAPKHTCPKTHNHAHLQHAVHVACVAQVDQACELRSTERLHFGPLLSDTTVLVVQIHFQLELRSSLLCFFHLHTTYMRCLTSSAPGLYLFANTCAYTVGKTHMCSHRAKLTCAHTVLRTRVLTPCAKLTCAYTMMQTRVLTSCNTHMCLHCVADTCAYTVCKTHMCLHHDANTYAYTVCKTHMCSHRAKLTCAYIVCKTHMCSHPAKLTCA